MHLDKNEFLGVIFGQAIGYALGLGIEFMYKHKRIAHNFKPKLVIRDFHEQNVR